MEKDSKSGGEVNHSTREGEKIYVKGYADTMDQGMLLCIPLQLGHACLVGARRIPNPLA